MNRVWVPDESLPTYQSTTLPLPPEDDGALVATVLRKRATSGTPAHDATAKVAFLYVHGFIDYFFHEHVADAILATGMDFYAIDLRRHGRSLREGNRPNYCTNLSQYFAEVTAAIDIIVKEDGHERVVLYAHSTGAVVASLYAHEGARKENLAAVILNSPFFGFSVTPLQSMKIPVAVLIGGVLPALNDKHAITPWYGEGLHVSRHGEWNYNLAWKPINGFPAYFGWARAIKHSHDRIARGLAIKCPVLVLHSDSSGPASEWSESIMTRDIVLNVKHMRERSAGLGANVQRTEIPGAIHDVMLSRASVRANALNTMLQWLPVSYRSQS